MIMRRKWGWKKRGKGKKEKKKRKNAVDQSGGWDGGFVGCGFCCVCPRRWSHSNRIVANQAHYYHGGHIEATDTCPPVSLPPSVRHISSLNSGLDTKIQTETVPVANDDNDLAMMTTTIFFFFFFRLGPKKKRENKRHFSWYLYTVVDDDDDDYLSTVIVTRTRCFPFPSSGLNSYNQRRRRRRWADGQEWMAGRQERGGI